MGRHPDIHDRLLQASARTLCYVGWHSSVLLFGPWGCTGSSQALSRLKVSILSWLQMLELIGLPWMMMTSQRSFPSCSKNCRLQISRNRCAKELHLLLQGILQDVFSQRAASAWQGAQPQKLTVSMLLPGTSSATEWGDLLQSRRQFWACLSCPGEC